jgi:hypothetical protein
MSPDLSKAFRKLSTRVNVKKSKSKTATAAVESVESASSIPTGSGSVSGNVHKVSATSSLVLSQPLMPHLRSDEKAFRVPAVVVKTQRSGDVIRQISLPAGTVQADQGSELNLISIGLVKAMHYKPLSLSSKGFSGLAMNTADGSSSALTHFVTFWLSVLGIWRKANAFIHPYDREAAPKDLHLLLGLPWLESVDAKIGVRDCRIEIGDTKRGEKVVVVQGPKFVPSLQHSLVLYPSGPKLDNAAPAPVHAVNEELGLDESESDSSSESDAESDSDDSDASGISGN